MIIAIVITLLSAILWIAPEMRRVKIREKRTEENQKRWDDLREGIEGEYTDDPHKRFIEVHKMYALFCQMLLAKYCCDDVGPCLPHINKGGD